MIFDITYNNKLCGRINTYNEGFYEVFDVNCQLISLDISRVYLKNNQNIISLGVLMPKNNSYVLRKKLPIAYVKKNNINEDFIAYVECEQQKLYINDKNLRVISDKLIKKSYANFDVYMFLYGHEFLFDFCFSLCEFKKIDGKQYVTLKTDKNGKVIV